MFLIAGLGNPGKKYALTRHNMGRDCVDILAKDLGIKMKRSRFNALVGKGHLMDEDIILVQPQTFMNLSGNAISGLLKYYKITPEDHLIVIYDDTDLDPGRLRIRLKGQAGGHNGVKSVISSIGTDSFIRVRVGIGARGQDEDMIEFVLGRFSAQERKQIEQALEAAADAVKEIVTSGPESAMNKYNGYMR